MNCPELLKDINFRVPYLKTWCKETFFISGHTQNYSFHNPLNRMCKSSNEDQYFYFHTCFEY